jgi:hypothetical protein
MNAQEIVEVVGRRIAQDLAEQAARTGPDAAREAGCRTVGEIDLWTERFRSPADGPLAA